MSRMKELLMTVMEIAKHDEEQAIDMLVEQLGYDREHASAIIETYNFNRNHD